MPSQKEIEMMRPFVLVWTEQDACEIRLDDKPIKSFTGFDAKMMNTVEAIANMGYQEGYMNCAEAKWETPPNPETSKQEPAGFATPSEPASKPEVTVLGDTSNISARLKDSMKTFAEAVGADRVTFVDHGETEELFFHRGTEEFAIGAYGNRMDGAFFGYPSKKDGQQSLSKGV